MVSVGIDISKDKSTVCMLRPYGEVVEAPYNIEHTEQALNALIERIKSFDEDVKVVLEATGGYHQVVVTKLLSAGIFTVVVNPYESGKFVGTKRNISKRGSSTLRKIGYEIMHSLKVVKPTEDSSVYDFIIKKETEGKPKRVAKIAGLNKFLRIYYARVMEIYC